MGSAAVGARALFATWWRALLGAVLAAPLCFLLGQCDGKRIARAGQKAAVAQARARQAERERAADANLTATRQQQSAAIVAARKEVDDATAHIPDQAPSARQRARACLELRRQAAAGTAPPAC